MNQFNSHTNKLEEEIDPSGGASLKPALGFCALGLVAATLVVPMMSGKVDTTSQFAASGVQSGSSVDKITTGAVSVPKTKRRFTITRSVLQRDPSKPCIVYTDGTQEGGC